MRPKNVLGIAGSLRRRSYNRLLLQAAAERAPVGMTLSIYSELAEIPLFNEDLEEGTGPDAVVRLRRQVAAADGIMIATPEYNQSVPGVLKNAIDWLSRPGPGEVLVGKPIALVGVTAGRWGTRLAQAALRQVLFATESLVLPKPALYAREGARLFEADRLIDEPTIEMLAEVLDAFGGWIELVAP